MGPVLRCGHSRALHWPGRSQCADLSRQDHQVHRAVHAWVAGRCGRTRDSAGSAKTARPRVILETRSGAGSATGTKAAAAAAPDGYTLLLTGTPLVFLPTMYPNAGGEIVKDLVPIASFLIWSHVIVVLPDIPAKTLPELVAYAKANPGELVWGYGLGSTPHILGESLKQATGTDIASIPYRGGDQARADLLGGRVHMNIAPLAAMLPLIQEGKVRALAFTGAARSVDLPDVPTT